MTGGKPATGVLVLFQIEVTTPGKIGINLNSAKGIRFLSIDGKSATAPNEAKLTSELGRGVHTFALGLDLAQRGLGRPERGIGRRPGDKRPRPAGGRKIIYNAAAAAQAEIGCGR